MQDSAYYVLVQDDDAHIFDHWNDGSRFLATLITPTAPAVALTTAHYRNSGLAAPQSLASLTPYPTGINVPKITGTADPGLSVQLHDGSAPIGSPATV